MAKDANSPEPAAPPVTTEADKTKARSWFKKAAVLRDQRNYDYAIECIITGLGFWPDAVEEGHSPLRLVSLQRAQAGGKKPGMMDSMKLSVGTKDPKAGMLAAEALLAKDFDNGQFLDAVLKNAAKGEFYETVKWIAPDVFKSIRTEKKPNPGRYKTFREIIVDVAGRCDSSGDPASCVELLELAIASIELQIMQNPSDMPLKDEQRDLAGRLTITKGKYENGGTFRDSVRDVEKQTQLHDQERIKQSESSLDNLIAVARKEMAANPGVPGKINALVDLLLKSERQKEEDEAIDILMKAFESSKNYSFKMRADDVRLRQASRTTRQLKTQAQESGSEDDSQNARLAEMDEVATEVEIFTERVKNYPTDLRMKYRLGSAYFRSGDYDQAIPMLQTAQGDPRNRTRALMMLGRCFHEKGLPAEAAEIIKEALDRYELSGDDTQKELLYRLAQAHKAAGNKDDAKAVLGKLLRQDYNYADGEARKLVDELK